MSARSLAVVSLLGLLALQPAWYLWLAPPQALPGGLAIALAWAPLAIPSVNLLRQRPNALFWAAVASLLHFCHGVMEAWSNPAVRELALAETALATGLILAVGADGLARRRAARAASAQNL